MPSGAKKRRAAKKQKEHDKNLGLKSIEKSHEVISITSSRNADQEDGSLCGNFATVVMSKLEDESEKKAFSVDDKLFQANIDFDPEKSKENKKTSEPESSLSAKEDTAMSPSQEKRKLLVRDSYEFRTKIGDSKPKKEVESAEVAGAHVSVKVTQENVDESTKESEVFVLQSLDESLKKSIKDAAKMTQTNVASDSNGTDVNALPLNGEKTETIFVISTIPAEGPVHDNFKMSEANVVSGLKENEENVVPLGADKKLESATSVLTYFKVNNEISPAFEDNFVEFMEGSDFINKNKDKHNLGFKDAPNTIEDDLFFLGSNSMFDTPSADETGLKDSSVAILAEDSSGFIPKQDDDISPSVVVNGFDTADKENEVDIQIQNDSYSSFSTISQKMRDGPKGDDQHEALQATKSTISNDELHQTSPQLSYSGCILCELVGGNAILDGKILTTRIQINRAKKMLEEELLATDKLRATLKKLLDELEVVQNNNYFGLSA